VSRCLPGPPVPFCATSARHGQSLCPRLGVTSPCPVGNKQPRLEHPEHPKRVRLHLRFIFPRNTHPEIPSRISSSAIFIRPSLSSCPPRTMPRLPTRRLTAAGRRTPQPQGRLPATMLVSPPPGLSLLSGSKASLCIKGPVIHDRTQLMSPHGRVQLRVLSPARSPLRHQSPLAHRFSPRTLASRQCPPDAGLIARPTPLRHR
jgi:hypothetical protein